MNRLDLLACLIAFSLIEGATSSPLHAQSQHEMNQQAAADFRKADKSLNGVYKQVISKLDQEAQEKLRKAQRAWVLFRDAEADLAADLEARGGSMAPLIYDATRTSLTEARTNELRRLLQDYAQ